MNIILSGRIDSNNAGEVENDIAKRLAEAPGEVPVFDASGLEYISSAGLRVLLKFRKAFNQKLDIINVSDEVYSIFEVTGFNELLNVKKKLREVSIEGCPAIGGGTYSTVYRLDPEMIIKVCDKQPMTLEKLEADQKASREVFLHDIPTAISYDVVKVGEHYGIVYEMIDADTLSRTIKKQPERTEELGLKTARLFKKLHTTEFEPGTFPDARIRFMNATKSLFDAGFITSDDKNIIDSILYRVPDRNTFVHGDFHPNNILVRNNELVLIDVGDAGLGHPIFDLTISYSTFDVLARFSAEHGSDIHEKTIGLNYEQLSALWEVIMPEYFGTTDKDILARNSEIMKYYALIYMMYIMQLFNPQPYDIKKLRITQFMTALRSVANTLTPIE